MINLHPLTRSHIDKFFDCENNQETLKYASLLLNKAITEIEEKFSEDFSHYLRDEFRLLFDEIIRREVIRVISDMLKGDVAALEEFHLAPNDWGLKCDAFGLRRKIVEENQDIIRNTYIRGIEEELERARETIKHYQDRRY